jgi:hypothetical protein
MSNGEYYIELIQKLTAHLVEKEKEITELNNKLSYCEGELKAYSQFYLDLKPLNRTDIVLNNKQLSIVSDGNIPLEGIGSKITPTYDILRGDYFTKGDTSILKRLFEDYDVKPFQVLSDIQNKLPDNIKDLVKQYKCKKEYNIILKSNRNIKKFTKDTNFSERDINDLDINYIKNYNNENKDTALLYLKQALVYFPFQFDKFLNAIKQYRYDDLDQYIEKLKIELYGENNILLNNESNKILPLPQKRGRKGTDYKNISIPELVELVKNVNHNPKQKMAWILDSMKKAGRTEEECLLFEEEVNKTLLNNKKEKIIKEKIEKYYADYKNVSIPELVELVKKCENKRMKTDRILKGMKKAGRTEDDCSLFKEEANKLLTKKI